MIKINPIKQPKPSSSQSQTYFSRESHAKQIKPIPMVYHKICYQKHQKAILRLSAKGFKYISNAAATGQYTNQILNKMRQMSRLKLIKSFEFDPYFCEGSALKPLAKFLKKMKRSIYKLNFTIRKFMMKDELSDFCPFISRLNKLTKLRIDFSNAERMNDQNLTKFGKAYVKITTLKILEVNLIGLKSFSRNYESMRYTFMRLPHLEILRYKLQSSHVSNAANPRELKAKNSKTKFHKLKCLSLKVSFNTGWTSFFDGSIISGNNAPPTILNALQQNINPVSLSFSFNKFPMSTLILMQLAKMPLAFTNLRFMFLELTKIKLNEYEFLLLARGFVQCKHLEHLTFKYQETTPVPLQDVIQFITIMAQHAPFPKFDLFFRKLFHPEWSVPEITNKLQSLEGVEYVLTKQSIHIQKKLKEEE